MHALLTTEIDLLAHARSVTETQSPPTIPYLSYAHACMCIALKAWCCRGHVSPACTRACSGEAIASPSRYVCEPAVDYRACSLLDHHKSHGRAWNRHAAVHRLDDHRLGLGILFDELKNDGGGKLQVL